MKLLSFFTLLTFLLPSQRLAHASGTDLHAHLFMKEGLGLLFRGGFNDPLQAKSWKDGFSSQANPKSLDESKLDIVVAALYAHPFLKLSVRDSIREQIKQAKTFAEEHPNWVLGLDPQQSAKAIRNGKQVLVLSLEGASGVLEVGQDLEENIKEFIDEGGIRIVTFLHLTDDELGGVAFLRGLRSLASPIAFLKSLFHPLHDEEGVRLNGDGLTNEGRTLAKRLIEKKVWIDLSHSSDASQKELIPMLKEAGQPLLYTHTVLRKYLGAERGLSSEQLTEIQKHGGLVGLMPSEDMLTGTPQPKPCREGLGTLSVQMAEIAKILPADSITIGSDFNGAIPHLRPSCETHTSLDQEGLWNIGQSQDLWQALDQMGTFKESPLNLKKRTEVFLGLWSRVWKKPNTG